MRNINQKYKRQKNKSRYIIVLRNTFQQKCQYAKSFQRKKMSNSNSSSEDEGNPNSSEGLHDTEVGIGDDVLTTSHLLLCIYSFQEEVEVVDMDTSSDDDDDGDSSTSISSSNSSSSEEVFIILFN